MNWVDLTDMLFCRAYGHLFSIKKPAYRNDVVEWKCIAEDKEIIAEGKTVKLAAAKDACKEVYRQLKANDTNIYYNVNSGKLKRNRR